MCKLEIAGHMRNNDRYSGIASITCAGETAKGMLEMARFYITQGHRSHSYGNYSRRCPMWQSEGTILKFTLIYPSVMITPCVNLKSWHTVVF